MLLDLMLKEDWVELKNKIMNVDKNSYTFSFAIIMVIVVAGLLSFTAINLKKPQLKNI